MYSTLYRDTPPVSSTRYLARVPGPALRPGLGGGAAPHEERGQQQHGRGGGGHGGGGEGALGGAGAAGLVVQHGSPGSQLVSTPRHAVPHH